MDTPDAGAINKLNRPKTKKNPHSQTWLWGFYWRRERDSNPRGIAPKLISSQPRYDHFDTSPRDFAILAKPYSFVNSRQSRGYDVFRLPAHEGGQVVNADVHETLPGLQRRPGHMGRDDAVGDAQKRAVLGHGLGFPDIERGAAQLAALQGVGQRRFVHDGAPCRVDEERALLHAGERLIREKPIRLRVQGAMDGDDIRLLQQ